LFSKELNKLTKADLEKLITDKISENQQLEYKRELPARNGKKETNSEKISDYARNEILSEIVAFTNSQGGYLILGISDNTRIPEEICPIQNCDTIAAKLVQQCRDCISPPIPSLNIHPILFDDKNSGAIVIKVPKSHLAPHRLETDKECYIRRGENCEKMNMYEIQDLTLSTKRGMEAVEEAFKSSLSEFKKDIKTFQLSPHNIAHKKNIWGVNAFAVPVGLENINHELTSSILTKKVIIGNQMTWLNNRSSDLYHTLEANFDKHIISEITLRGIYAKGIQQSTSSQFPIRSYLTKVMCDGTITGRFISETRISEPQYTNEGKYFSKNDFMSVVGNVMSKVQ